jgi:tetratricopeptide (TPR) repeat protein
MKKKLLGLALVPVVMAALPALAMANQAHQANQPAEANKIQSTKMDKANWSGVAIVSETFSAPYVRDTFNKAQWQLVEKNYPQAITLFEMVLKTDPASVRSLHGLATAFQAQGNHERALNAIDTALALDPVNTKLIFTKAQILDSMGEEAKALEQYLIFAALDPTDTNSLVAERRADELFRGWESRLSEAQKDYFNGLRFMAMEQPENAVPVLEEFIKIEPKHANGRMILGVAYRNLSQPNEAIAQFETITQTHPNSPVGFYHLGVMYDAAGKKQNAQQAWKNFVKYAPNTEATGSVNYRIQNIRN